MSDQIDEPTQPTAEPTDEARPAATDANAAASEPEPDAPTVTVYWRPGCGFCSSLRRQLQRAGVATVEVDIWDEPDAAAFVRSHARGNETVPTVDVAGSVFVNPSARQVVAAAMAAGIEVADPPAHWWQRG